MFESIGIINIYFSYISLMLHVYIVIILLNTLAAICQNLKQLLPRAVESLQQIVTDFIQSSMQPMDIALTAIFNALLRFQLVEDCKDLLTECVIALH